jgi:hypothetical protein
MNIFAAMHNENGGKSGNFVFYAPDFVRILL